MRIYLAAPWSHKMAARMAAEVLVSAGHSITTRWWEHAELPLDDHAGLQKQALDDLDGINTCDAFVLLELERSEGKSVEMGWALRSGKPVIVFLPKRGGETNVFQHLITVRRVYSFESVLAELANIGGNQQEPKEAISDTPTPVGYSIRHPRYF